ncbi:hypothetical protein GCM10010406_23690 [Streptomyces thermolineatus]|uniref:Uncharacterized protein n=1 Tax=Streptomyces thermolineatus TaxID=44033 RepID=A0ABP5YYI2_9ACTN
MSKEWKHWWMPALLVPVMGGFALYNARRVVEEITAPGIDWYELLPRTVAGIWFAGLTLACLERAITLLRVRSGTGRADGASDSR